MFTNKDIIRADIPVNYACTVDLLECLTQVHTNFDGFIRVKQSFSVDNEILQCFIVQILHHHV